MGTTETLNDPNKELVLTTREINELEADKKILEIDTVIDFNNIAEGSVVVLRIGGDSAHKMRMHQAFVRFVKSKGDLFKNKKLTVLFLEPGDSLEILTNEDMERAGWKRKEESRIITL